MAKLWAARFGKETDSTVNDFNSSISFDSRLYKEDITGSMAHAAMLGKQGIIENGETEKIIEGLKGILSDLESGKLQFSEEYEDVHMNIEQILTERIGDAGKRLHTARSRNDQVALDLRLYVKKEILAIGIAFLGSVVIAMADTGGGAGKNAVLGDILALLAAFFSACYTLIGTRERSHMSTIVYTYVLYWGCFLSLLVFDAVSGVPMTGYEPINWIMSLCLAVFCTLLGHSVFSWSLKFLTPTYVSTVKLAGPVFASISAILLFGEIPGLIQVAGAAVVLAGVYLYAKNS